MSGVEAGASLVVHGEHLDQVVDVIVNGAAVPGSFQPATGVWSGSAPALPAGEYRVDVVGGSCHHAYGRLVLP